MSDNYVQLNSAPSTGTSVAVTLNGVTAGNAIVAFAFDGARQTTPTTWTVSDAQGSYTARGTGVSTTDNVFHQIFTLLNANAGTHTATLTGQTSDAMFLVLVEVGTTAGVNAFSGVNHNSQASPGTGANALTSNSITVTGAATIVSIVNDTSSITGTDTPTAGTSFTSRGTTNDTANGVLRIQTIGVAASQAATGTAVTGTHNFITSGIAILNATASSFTDTSFNLASVAALTSSGTGLFPSASSVVTAATFTLVGSTRKLWRVPTTASAGTAVHVIVFSGSSPTYSILAQGVATVDASGYAIIDSAGTTGDKAFAFVHNYSDNTATTSIFGGAGIGTVP